jgi:endonuclease III
MKKKSLSEKSDRELSKSKIKAGDKDSFRLKTAKRKKIGGKEATQILEWFRLNKSGAKSELNFKTPFELIIAVCLSAQCTDKRVNMVTPALFKKYPTPESLAAAPFESVYDYVKSLSFPNNKAKHLVDMAKMLVSEFHSHVPSTVEELEKMPGVGRKTANVVASIIYGAPVIAVDTHVFRVAHRIGFSNGTTPLDVEKDLNGYIPVEMRAEAHHWLILHGRYVCTARKPKCEECGISEWCMKRLSDMMVQK